MPTPSIPRLAPLANGLVYVNPDMPGLRRVKRGTSFGYKDVDGQWLRDHTEIARIRKLAIPPAYTEVWICPLANGHLQALGLDARGRKQYRYHVAWRALKDETKFERLEAFGRALPRIRARVMRDLQSEQRQLLTRDRVLATIVRLLDTTYLRVGNEEYASSNGSYGLTTLRNQHAAVRGNALKLRFRGKSGVMHEAEVDDARIAKIVRHCQQLPGQDLFQYQDSQGEPHGISSTDVNAYLQQAAGDTGDAHFTAKDFRTWHGTVQALELTRLACGASGSNEALSPSSRYNAREILCAVAQQLGNTPAVCKKAYIHPAVLALGSQLAGNPGELNAIWARLSGRKQPVRRLLAAEHRLLGFLHEHKLSGGRNALPQMATRRRRTPSAVTTTA
jgi:DNA topoisomerase-1